MPTFSDMFSADSSSQSASTDQSYEDQTESSPPIHEEQLQSSDENNGTDGMGDDAALA